LTRSVALELAAARLRALPLEHLLGRLEDRFRLLTGGSRTALPRQQTLQATVDWSYESLGAPERRLFDRLSVFAGGWALEAAEAVCGGSPGAPEPASADRAGGVGGGSPTPAGAAAAPGVAAGPPPAACDLPADQVLDLLALLVDKSLVVMDEGAASPARYRLLETLRQYGRQRLVAGGEAAAVHARHAAHYLALAEHAAARVTGPEQGAWLDRLEEEQDNLRAALRWSLDRDEAGPGLRIVGALWVWYAVSFREGRRWAEALLALPGAAPPTVERTQALWTAGMAAWEEGDGAAVHALGEENVALSRALGDPGRLAYALAMLGNSARHDVPRVHAIFAEAQGAAKQDGDP
jgi:predicted ATPase